MKQEAILQEESNCWRIERAGRVAFLLDGESYFRAFRRAVLNARRSIHILAWDINHAIQLERGDQVDDDAPTELAALLHHMLDRHPELEINILVWDYAFIYAMEREWLQKLKFSPSARNRIRFELDDHHPVGASQHQKVVVIDNRIAFSGGFDLSVWRWDSSDHRAQNPLRKDPYGKLYQPYHDVQMLVEGDVAAALNDLFIERWQRATGDSLTVNKDDGDAPSPWPDEVSADLKNVAVAIARTSSQYRDRPARKEVEQLYLDAIRSAQSFIYLENQYLSSRSIGDALAERLEEADGPEVVLVLPKNTGGWLEQHTMDVMRIRIIKQLEAADHHGRFGVFYPRSVGEGEFREVYVHAKLQIVDDRFLRIGSSNLSNRSMGLDSECDLAIESGENTETTVAIRRLREKLLADHFGWIDSKRPAGLRDDGSLLQLVRRSIRESGKTLLPLEVEFASDLDRRIAEAHWLDPEQPVDPDVLMREMLPEDQRLSARGRIVIFASLVAGVLGLVALWRWSPLSDSVDSQTIKDLFHTIQDEPLSPLLAFLVFLIGSSCGVPLNLMLLAATVVFGPWLGFLYGYGGACVSSAATYGVGHLIGKPVVRKMAGPRWKKLNNQLAKKGLLFVALIRLIPVAPFLVVNLVAGVSRVRFRDFLLGTLVGLAPGMLAVTFLTDRFKAAFQHPTPTTVLTFLGSAVVVVVLVLLMRRWLGNKKHQD